MKYRILCPLSVLHMLPAVTSSPISIRAFQISLLPDSSRPRVPSALTLAAAKVRPEEEPPKLLFLRKKPAQQLNLMLLCVWAKI